MSNIGTADTSWEIDSSTGSTEEIQKLSLRERLKLFGLGFSEVKRIFTEPTRSRVRRILRLVGRMSGAEAISADLRKEKDFLLELVERKGEKLKDTLAELALTQQRLRQQQEEKEEAQRKWQEFATRSATQKQTISKQGSDLADLRRKLNHANASQKDREIPEKTRALFLIQDVIMHLGQVVSGLSGFEKELNGIAMNLGKSLTEGEAGEIPLIIEIKRFAEVESEIREIVEAFQKTTNEGGEEVLLVENPMFELAAQTYHEALELRKDHLKWNEAFEVLVRSLGLFQAAKHFEDTVIAQHESAEPDDGLTAEQRQAINVLTAKNADWLEDRENGPWLKNFYEVLGVDPEAPPGDIDKAYKAKVRETHTDTNGGDHADIAAINVAAGVLKEQKQRQDYDHYFRIFYP